MASEKIAAEQLHGTWKLVAAQAKSAQGALLPPPYGPEPMGRLVLARSGRMMAVLCDGRTTIPIGEVRAYSSYCGNYRVEGDRMITHVDAALVTERIGGEQVRKLAFRGTQLVLIPPRRTDGEQRELFWQREALA